MRQKKIKTKSTGFKTCKPIYIIKTQKLWFPSQKCWYHNVFFEDFNLMPTNFLLFLNSIDPDTPEYDEPKFIVFYRMLLSLFTLFCFNCKWNSPSASMRQDGTMVTVTQSCLHCNKEFVWRSQPLILGKYPAGNILLSFGVLMAGASINKILLVFRHMGLCVYSARTFFRHQKSFLFPIVLHYWETYRAALIQKLKGLKEVAWSGDGRFDSMGHSAKYGVYTMFCTTLMKIVHFELVQVSVHTTVYCFQNSWLKKGTTKFLFPKKDN